MLNKKDNRYLLAGLLLGFLFISHLITAVYSVLATGVYLVIAVLCRAGISIKRYFAVLLIGLLTSAFWIYPFLSSQYLTGLETGFGTFTPEEMYKKITTENFLMNPVIVQIAMLGIAAIVF